MKGAKVYDLDPKLKALRQEHGTPKTLFGGLHTEYKFTVDCCASAENAKLTQFWDKSKDGLLQDWRGHRVWCNPPWENITPWLAKGWAEVQRGCDLAVYLLPSRTGTDWFRDYAIHATALDFFRERLAFDFCAELLKWYESQGRAAPKGGDTDCMLVVMQAGLVGKEPPALRYRSRADGARVNVRPLPAQMPITVRS